MSDMTYPQFVHERIVQLHVQCGDVLETRVSSTNAEAARMISQVIQVFLAGYQFLPQEVVMHSSLPPEGSQHLRHMEVFLLRNGEDIERLLAFSQDTKAVVGITVRGDLADVGDLPTTVNYVYDETYSPSTVSARYTVPLCDGCLFKQRYRDAATASEREEILTQAKQARVVLSFPMPNEEEQH